LILNAMNEAYETGRYYLAWSDTINMQTPFYGTIWATNLCVEIMLPTTGYASIPDLYSETDVGYIRFGTTQGNNYEIAANEAVYVDRPNKNSNRAARKVIPATGG
jgi:ribonucleotide reductase alpha subunit